MAPTTRAKVTVYIEHGLQAQLEQERKRVGAKRGRSVTVSAYIESVLNKHLSRRSTPTPRRTR